MAAKARSRLLALAFLALFLLASLQASPLLADAAGTGGLPIPADSTQPVDTTAPDPDPELDLIDALLIILSGL